MSNTPWITALGTPSFELCNDTQSQIAGLIKSGLFTEKDIEYVAKLERPVLKGRFSVPPERLSRLRRLCQTWDIEIKLSEIKSHRPLLGPLIVGLKKVLFPILKILLKDFVKAQREFNAAAIMLLAEICNEERDSKTDTNTKELKKP